MGAEADLRIEELDRILTGFSSNENVQDRFFDIEQKVGGLTGRQGGAGAGMGSVSRTLSNYSIEQNITQINVTNVLSDQKRYGSAGEDIKHGDPVYMKKTNGKIYRYNSTVPFYLYIGIAMSDASNDQDVIALYVGVFTFGKESFTTGKSVYVNAAGSLVQDLPSPDWLCIGAAKNSRDVVLYGTLGYTRLETSKLTADIITDGTMTITGGAITGATGLISQWANDVPYLTSLSVNIFKTIACPAGASPVADSSTDTLTLTSTDAGNRGTLAIVGNSATDTVDFQVDVNADLSEYDNSFSQFLTGADAPIEITGTYYVGIKYNIDDFGLEGGGSDTFYIKDGGIDHNSLTNTHGDDWWDALGDIALTAGYIIKGSSGNVAEAFAKGANATVLTLNAAGNFEWLLYANWNTAYAWNDHSLAGYFNAQSDVDHSLITNAHNLTSDIDHDALTNFLSGEHFLQSAITAISSGVGSGLVKSATGTLSVITDNSGSWNTAYGWGDHSGEGYLKNIVEDGSPQLGADLDCQSLFDIVNTKEISFGGTTGLNILGIGNNLADSLSVKDGATFYMTFKTVAAQESVHILQDLEMNDKAIKDIASLAGGGDAILLGDDLDGLTNSKTITAAKIGIGVSPVFLLDIGGTAFPGMRITGSSQASFLLIDSGGGVNQKGFQFACLQNVAKFRSLTDAQGIHVDNVFVIKLLDGNIGFGIVDPLQKFDLGGVMLARDAIYFTQTDGNEFIDSLNDGYMDYGATTAHRFNADIDVGNNALLNVSTLNLISDTVYGIGWDGDTTNAPSKNAVYDAIVSLTSGEVTASAILADNSIVRGDGGARGVQDSGILIDDTDNITGVANLTVTNITVNTALDMTNGAITDIASLAGGGDAILCNDAFSISEDLIVNYGQSGAGKITIKSGSTSEGNLYFTDATDGRGRITYDHNTDDLSFWTLSGKRMSIQSDGSIDFFSNTLFSIAEIRLNNGGKVILNDDGGDDNYVISNGDNVEIWRQGQKVMDFLVDGVEFPKTNTKLTALGGRATKYTNKTGANTIRGQLVKFDTAVDFAVVLTAPNDDECIGVFLENGVANDAEVWVVTEGNARIMFDDNVGTLRGDWVGTGAAGLARRQAAPPALGVAAHFEEVGHCMQLEPAAGGGTNILSQCKLQFN